MDVSTLSFSRYAAPGGCFHISRQHLTAYYRDWIHRHDFPELFWIERGTGTHRIADTEYELSSGDLACIRPEDVHGLGGTAGGLFLVNLALAPAVVADLAARYGADGDLWSGGPTARRRRLGPAAIRRLGAQVADLTRAYGGPRERLAVDRFLLELIDCVSATGDQTPGPGWLREAILTLAADPRLLSQGPSVLPGLCHHSREHIARTVRRCLGVSPRELIDGLRLERAAQALRMSDRPILAIALDQGYANLSHFYRRFRLRYDCTPRTYRNLHQELLGR